VRRLVRRVERVVIGALMAMIALVLERRFRARLRRSER
jgi:hypothetical protein